MKILSTLLIAAVLFISACDKKQPTVEGQTGTMRVFVNSACEYYIQLDAGSKIYPINKEKIQGFLTDGKKVTISYRLAPDFVSPCSGASSAIVDEIR